jgi:signal transduction histidine kinase
VENKMADKSKVLIVEDEAIVALDIQNCLVALGYEVVGTASSGNTAIKKARESKPDLVLMDITLKGPMDGIEAADLIRMGSDVPVVYLTAHADEHTLSRAKTSQVYGYILKPFEERDVRVAVETALYKHKTEIKLAEYERARNEAERLFHEAQKASNLKDEFLATISHELRTPLNPIIGYIDLIKVGAMETPEEFTEALDVIERNAKALGTLVEDLLDASRIISGKLQLNKSTVSLEEIVQETVRSLYLAARAKGVSLQAIADSVVRPVLGDEARLRQVIWNLLSNAVRFTPKGGSVRAVVQDRGSKVELAVIDNGQGIDPDFLPHIFERFRQEDGTKTRTHGGLGLGLSIVRHIVELHGGEVAARSLGKGKGATFCVSLPIAPISNAEFFLKPYRHNPSDDSKRGRETLVGVKVLVVEDARDSRKLIKKVLEQFGAEVIAVDNARLALQELNRSNPQVVLCDIGMSEMDGYSFIKALRVLQSTKGNHVPAAALTAYIGDESRKRAIEVGFDEHISKPVEAGNLVSIVARLAKNSAEREKNKPVSGW